MNAPSRQKLGDMPPAQQAGILCNDPRFQRFAAMRCGLPGKQFTTSATDCCQIPSRNMLNTSANAQTKLAALRTDFDAWTGKIATPR